MFHVLQTFSLQNRCLAINFKVTTMKKADSSLKFVIIIGGLLLMCLIIFQSHKPVTVFQTLFVIRGVGDNPLDRRSLGEYVCVLLSFSIKSWLFI